MDDTDKIELEFDNNAIIKAVETTAIQPNPDSWQTISVKLISFFMNFIPNLLFLNFSGINDSKFYNVFLFFLWAGIAALVWLISIGIDAPQIVFTLYCCSAWLIGLAVIFLSNV